jgi:hypothetical protein
MTIRQYYVSVQHPDDVEKDSPFFPVEADSIEAAAEAAALEWDGNQLEHSYALQGKIIETVIQNPNDSSSTFRIFVNCSLRPFYTVHKR